MKFKDIIIWLTLFIVGSLIVSWILNGGVNNAFYFVGNKIQEVKDNLNTKSSYSNQPDSNLKEVQLGKGTCSQTDAISRAYGVSIVGGRDKLCEYICSSQNFGEAKYSSCSDDRLICHYSNSSNS